ncbi:MAG: acylphosphatase [Oscillatoriales cyanobacterium RM2_1_1]|nr:acylphosphatase [Oscillatoriales cyanobacterium SM2_3_0]NJO45609.1 acylphosphatase [Oscillatoriales cyanobacterium RM2_1_1]
MIHAHVFISGQVQGVGYRIATLEAATARGLQGWVRNLPDGRVEAVFEGDRPQVEAMVQWCDQGSATARPEDVRVEYGEPEGLQGFQITP